MQTSIITGASGRSLEGFLIGLPLSLRVDIFVTFSGGGGGTSTIATGVVVSAFRFTPFLDLKKNLWGKD